MAALYNEDMLPSHIPSGSRIVVRIADGIDERSGRRQYRDFIGHAVSWDGTELNLHRDASANGSRPAEDIVIPARIIVRMKPVPEKAASVSGRPGKALIPVSPGGQPRTPRQQTSVQGKTQG